MQSPQACAGPLGGRRVCPADRLSHALCSRLGQAPPYVTASGRNIQWSGQSCTLQLSTSLRGKLLAVSGSQMQAHMPLVAAAIGALAIGGARCLVHNTHWTAPSAYDGLQGKAQSAHVPSDMRGTLLCADRFDEDGMLRLRGRRLAKVQDTPIKSLFWAAGFSFSRKDLLQEVCCSHLA